MIMDRERPVKDDSQLGEKTKFSKKIEFRSEKRTGSEKKASVEFMPGGINIPYHFKLKDLSSKGLGIIVRKDSKVLDHIKPGDVLDMLYHPDEATANPVAQRTQIKHISEPEPGKHEDHMLVGLMIVK
jgi:hypothetical protein